jgi:hypothetical protein
MGGDRLLGIEIGLRGRRRQRITAEREVENGERQLRIIHSSVAAPPSDQAD